jgi:integrase
MYAGLRLGEIMGLEWDAVDFDAGVIDVRRSWDQRRDPIAPKSRAGIRTVPLAGVCARFAAAQARVPVGRRPGLRSGTGPPVLPKTTNDRAQARGGRQACGRSACTSAGTPTPRS